MAEESLKRQGIVYAGDYALVTLTLLTPSGSYRLDIKNLLDELSYQEDLFNNCVYGYVNITDADGYIEKLSISGDEFLRLQLGKADNTSFLIDKLFRVYKIAKRKPDGQGMTESYSLYFCSEEMMLSEQYKILKSYQNKSVSQIVDDILTNYLKVPYRKSGDLEETYGTYDFIIPNLKPFDAINWLCTYARPMPPNTGADLLFYEDRDGYKLRSLQTLYTQQDLGTYNYAPKNAQSLDKTESDLTYNVDNALTYEIMDSFDTLSATNGGLLANSVLNVDILLRRAFLQKFNYETDYVNKATQLNDQPGVNYSYKNRLGDQMNETHMANFKLVFGNSKQAEYPGIDQTAVARDIFAEVYIPNRTAQLPLSTYMRAKISVWGNPLLTVGRTISFNLLSKDPKNKQLDPFYSGRYIITAVRHLLTFDNYRTVIEMAKDSNPYHYDSVDNSSTLWQNTAKGLK